jgi:hypothetical protein
MAKAAPRSRSTSRNELKQADDPFSRIVDIMSNLIIPSKYEAAHLKTQAEAVLSLAKLIDGGELRSPGDTMKASRHLIAQFLDFQVPLNQKSASEKFLAFWSSNKALDLLVSVLCVNMEDVPACTAVIRILSTLDVDSVRLWASLSFNKYKPLTSLINFTCRSCPEDLIPTTTYLLASVCSEPGAAPKIAELFAKNNVFMQFLIKRACEDGAAQIHASKLFM